MRGRGAVDHDDLDALRRSHAAWRLLRADHAPLIIHVLGAVFVEENAREVAAPVLIDRLDDLLYGLRDRDPAAYPKPASAYLDDWTAAGWLTKRYPPGTDEPHYDATPAVEKAVAWVEGLRTRAFVGTESRLNTLLELLRQMTFGSEADASVRLAELHLRRAALDAEIERVERGDFAVLDEVGQRDRFQQFSAMARELLGDFREVETNFRALDRELRERIARWSGSKGQLLDEVVGGRASIGESDQGRSFRAFYDFLLSHDRQSEFGELLARVLALPAIGGGDARLRHIHHDWIDAAEQTQATVRRLSEQLRRYLDDQAWLDNRRVMDILRSIESTALSLRDHDTGDFRQDLDDTAPTVSLPMERRLYRPSASAAIDSSAVAPGVTDFDATTLFEQVHVDRARLGATVRQALVRAPHVGLPELLDAHPLQHGLAELLTYLSLRDDAFSIVFDEDAQIVLRWSSDGGERAATVPRVLFVRTGEGTA